MAGQNTVFTYSTPGAIIIATEQLESALEWHALLQDKHALYSAPAAHHRELLHQAYALRDAHAIDAVTLGDMLELADAALEHAMERLSDEPH